MDSCACHNFCLDRECWLSSRCCSGHLGQGRDRDGSTKVSESASNLQRQACKLDKSAVRPFVTGPRFLIQCFDAQTPLVTCHRRQDGALLDLVVTEAGGQTIFSEQPTSTDASTTPVSQRMSEAVQSHELASDAAVYAANSTVVQRFSVGIRRVGTEILPVIQHQALGATPSPPQSAESDDVRINAAAGQKLFGVDPPQYARLAAVMPEDGRLVVLARARNSPALSVQTFLAGEDQEALPIDTPCFNAIFYTLSIYALMICRGEVLAHFGLD